MRRRLVLLAAVGIVAGATVPMAFASPPGNAGNAVACAAVEAQHGAQGGQAGGPPEDNNGLTTAEGVLACADND